MQCILCDVCAAILHRMNRNKRKNEEIREEENAESKESAESKRRINWSQEDTERLAQLVIQFGRSGILNKQTNGATNAKKKLEWDIIRIHFNSHPMVN